MSKIRKIMVISTIVVLTLVLFTQTAFALEYTIESGGQQYPCSVSLDISDDIAQKSNLSADMFEAILPEYLKGLGKTLYDGEQTYNMSGIFILSIIELESDYGRSRLATECNNVGGINGEHGYRNFDSQDECVTYMFDFLSRKYIANGRDTIGEVGSIYCTPPEGWILQVTDLMGDLIIQCR